MLWSETAGETLTRRTDTENSKVTVHPNIIEGRFGEKIHSTIRRFVIVRVNRQQHFVEACAITTYGERGVLKPGCNASEHTIAYLRGRQPQYYPGEYEKGMTKTPIAIEPTDPNEKMLPSSRLRLGKTYSIECNVKVRDIGNVALEHKTTLLRYYQESKDLGFEPDDPPPQNWPAPQGGQGYHGYYQSY
ncbi:hypothetical protein CC86DRAFT_300156 [Ophiobolus disseminans]|uniref:DUF6590 domain-containing protein n=1 Tax=Ophiobolus disseminans TaxID=1469910 RepID=A0A6A6ZQU7_9PLEO|nr:hypothetical protein CC86DRAFT_300156 [Ophiobolus disseminans]